MIICKRLGVFDRLAYGTLFFLNIYSVLLQRDDFRGRFNAGFDFGKTNNN